MTVAFDASDGAAGVEVVDAIEHRRCLLQTPAPVDPASVRSPFEAPVDAAVSITTEAVAVEQHGNAYLRDADGAVVAAAPPAVSRPLPGRACTVELSTPVKLYLRTTAPGRLVTDRDRLRLVFDEPAEVVIGARSYHSRPAATVTVSPEPESVVRALSTLGSALKTTACERSFSTLRGHPPLLVLGDELHVPDDVSPPETGIRIEVPPTFAAAFAVAPLAYYLGATVRPGPTARIVTERGFEHRIGDDGGSEATPARAVERSVERLLKRTFFLDCLTRSEGPYQFQLHERAAVEDRIDLDFSAQYGRPLARRLEAYLSVPHAAIADALPRWDHTVYLEPAAESVEAVPFAVDDLAVVRTRRSPVEAESGGSAETPARRPAGVEFAAEGASGEISDRSVFGLPESDSIGRTWFGEGIPLGATKGHVVAHRNRLERSPSTAPIDVTVVCNDDSMVEESDAASEVYDSHDDVPADVTVREAVSVDELRSVLDSNVDFLHYVGHVDDDSFRCPDGTLDATDLGSVGVDTFVLNACDSVRLGVSLLEAGSVGGVATVGDVMDGSAMRMGYSMARLLELGFPLRAALEVAKADSLLADEYVVVGDGSVDLVQERTGVPTLCVIESADDDGPPPHDPDEPTGGEAGDDGAGPYDVTLRTYLSGEGGMGSVVVPFVDGCEEYFLAPGALPSFRLSESELEGYLRRHRMAVRAKGRLIWDPDELPPS